jgi:hypothetical protein
MLPDAILFMLDMSGFNGLWIGTRNNLQRIGKMAEQLAARFFEMEVI